MLCNTWARTHGYLSSTDAHSVINSDKEINIVSNCSEKYEEYPVKTNWGVIILRSAAKMHVCAIFLKMLIIAWNVCKQNLKRFWAILNFTRALTLARSRTRMFAHIYWRKIDRTDLDLNPDKYEWEMTIRYEDMIISWFLQNGA